MKRDTHNNQSNLIIPQKHWKQGKKTLGDWDYGYLPRERGLVNGELYDHFWNYIVFILFLFTWKQKIKIKKTEHS